MQTVSVFGIRKESQPAHHCLFNLIVNFRHRATTTQTI